MNLPRNLYCAPFLFDWLCELTGSEVSNISQASPVKSAGEQHDVVMSNGGPCIVVVLMLVNSIPFSSIQFKAARRSLATHLKMHNL